MAITAPYNRIDKYIVCAKLRQPLHVGSSEKETGEVLVHPVSGKPFVQASGIAGVFRSCYEELNDDKAMSSDLFGDNERTAGRIRFTDGIISASDKEMRIELRPRIKINPKTGTSASSKGKGLDSASGQKFETEYIGTGSEIIFRVYVYSKLSRDKLQAGAKSPDQEQIEQVFAQIHNGHLQFGGQKSNGCGSMEIVSLKHRAYNMCNENDRIKWAEEDKEDSDTFDEQHQYLNELLAKTLFSPRAYTLKLYAETEGSLLVKSIALTDAEIRKFAERDEKEPDYVNMRNAEGFYIIPGSSVKGAVRAQVERISNYMEKNMEGFENAALIGDAFGKTGKKNDTGSSGNVRFYDVLVEPIAGREKEVINNRIHIDRFTGGVMNTGLFKEQSVHGKFTIEAAVMKDSNRKNTAKEDRSCAMLTLALRDLALGIYSLGSGYSVGRGFLHADKLEILRSDNKKAVVKFSKDADHDGRIRMAVNDPDGVADKCLQALAVPCGADTSEKAGKEEV